MSDTTSIDDLPTDPSMGNQNNIILQKTEMNNGMRGVGGMGGMSGMGGMGEGGMTTNQVMPPAQVYSPNVAGVNMMGGGMGMQMPQQQMQQMPQQQNVMNELVNGLQRASASGLTNLPSRDIPMNTSNMMNDAQINPNFIPTTNPTQQTQVNQYGHSNMPSNNYIEEHEQDMTSEDKYRKSQNINSNAENIYKLIQIPIIVGILYFAFQLPVTRKYILKFIPSVFNSDGNYNISGLVFMSALFACSFFGLSKVLEMSESW